MQEDHRAQLRQKWAHLRFSIIGRLLASPPRRGELKSAIGDLAAKTWRHPRTGEPIRFGYSTIERWFHKARADEGDPVGALRRQVRKDRGGSPSMSEKLAAEFVDAMNGLGTAVKRREDTHKMAEANKAFSHFKW